MVLSLLDDAVLGLDQLETLLETAVNLIQQIEHSECLKHIHCDVAHVFVELD